MAFGNRQTRLLPARILGLGALVLIVAGMGLAGLTGALAQYGLLPKIAQERHTGGFLSATAGFRGAGLAPGSQASLSVIENGRSLFSGDVPAGNTGTFVSGAIPLKINGKDNLLVAMRVHAPERDDPAVFSFVVDPMARQVSMSGSGLLPESTVKINFGSPGGAVETAADWAGGFATQPDGGSPIMDGAGSACVDVSSASGKALSLCFDLTATVGPHRLQAAIGPDGKPQKESPYSTWTPPDDCKPIDTDPRDMSVCDPSSMNQAFRNAREIIVRAFMMMTEQFTANMMQQAEIVGALIDAKHQMEVQRWFGEKIAESHKDYQPSDQMCRFATFTSGLNAAQQKTRVGIRSLNKYMMERETAPVTSTSARGTGAPGGPGQDIRTRSEQFRDSYCDPAYNNSGGLSEMCRAGSTGDRRNKDIDFMRLVEMPLTLDVDFTDTTASNDETDILTLSKYLYSNDINQRPDNELIAAVPGEGGRREGVNTYQDSRSLNAVRSVARNSFARLVGEKQQGTNTSGQYMKAMLREFNMPDADIEAFMGRNPSYFAQMEFITRKMFQHPNFFANLYDTPVNVERQGATLQAIRLMHDRDRFEASLRREMLVAMLLEMKLRRAQDHLDQRIQGNISTQLPSGSGFSILP